MPCVVHLREFAQFQLTMRRGTLARTAHFSLHALRHRFESPAPTETNGTQNTLLRRKYPPTGVWRIGALLPKRCAKRAVTRNLMRRQVYAQFAASDWLHRGTARTGLETWDVVIRLHQEFSRHDFPSASSEALRVAIRSELQDLLAQAARAPIEKIALLTHPLLHRPRADTTPSA